MFVLVPQTLSFSVCIFFAKSLLTCVSLSQSGPKYYLYREKRKEEKVSASNRIDKLFTRSIATFDRVSISV